VDRNHDAYCVGETRQLVTNTNLDLVVMIENWYPKSTP